MRKKTAIVAVLFLLGAGAGCGLHSEKPAPETDEIFPPEELVLENVKSMDLSLEYELLSVSVLPSKDPSGLYGEWKMEAKALRCFDGDLAPNDQLIIYCMFEEGIQPPKTHAKYLGSFKRKTGKEYYVPDNGYWFEYQDTLAGFFEKGAQAKHGK